CPHELQPFELYWFARARNFGKTQEYQLFDCIECGCCAYVCPARIPLVQYFRFAKSEIWARERDKRNADAARERYERHQAREARDQAEKAERLAKAAAAKAAVPEGADGEAAKKAIIAAAVERARVQREGARPENTENP
ncbi:MAG: electron transport complex subunit RsxC, partial [Candidatus Accumulibacter sp.]|nr:electron transport complex subunit RsxC [Accumulibacter sp.]